MRKKVRRKKGITVTVKKDPRWEKLKRGVKRVRRGAMNLMAVIGFGTVLVVAGWFFLWR